MVCFCYIELFVVDIVVLKVFYVKVFGWMFVDFGFSYVVIIIGDVDVGLQGDLVEVLVVLLLVIVVDDLEVVLVVVMVVGGIVVWLIFGFFGGCWFQFCDLYGNELVVMQVD